MWEGGLRLCGGVSMWIMGQGMTALLAGFMVRQFQLLMCGLVCYDLCALMVGGQIMRTATSLNAIHGYLHAQYSANYIVQYMAIYVCNTYIHVYGRMDIHELTRVQ